MQCSRCKGRGGGYETCYGWYPDITYDYVDIGDCEHCNGTGEVEDIPDDWEDGDDEEPVGREGHKKGSDEYAFDKIQSLGYKEKENV